MVYAKSNQPGTSANALYFRTRICRRVGVMTVVKEIVSTHSPRFARETRKVLNLVFFVFFFIVDGERHFACISHAEIL